MRSDRHNDPERENGRNEREPMPMLLFFLGVHCLMGLAIGVAFASIIVMLNTAGIRDLLKASNEPFIPMFLFYASCALTFASAKMGMAVMSLPFDPPSDDDPPSR